LAFAERMAMLSVRRLSADILLDGLTALVMTGPPVDREFILMTASLLHHSARQLGLDVAATFEQAARYANPSSEAAVHLLAFPDRAPRLQRIAAMGYREVQGPSGLVYWSGSGPIPPGLLHEDAVSEAAIHAGLDLEPFFERCFADPTYSGRYQPDRAALRRLDPQERATLADRLWQAFQAGSRDTRVLLGLGILDTDRSAGPLKALLSSTADDRQRVSAALALWHRERLPQAQDAVIDVLSRAPAVEARRDAAFRLRQFPGREAAQALVGALHDADQYVRFQALQSLVALSGLSPQEVEMPALVGWAMSDDPQAREKLVERARELITTTN
jgi:hypothetical protein